MLSTSGDTHLGGDDFDKVCVYIYIYDIFKTELSFLVKSFLSLSPIFLFVGGI